MDFLFAVSVGQLDSSNIKLKMDGLYTGFVESLNSEMPKISALKLSIFCCLNGLTSKKNGDCQLIPTLGERFCWLKT